MYKRFFSLITAFMVMIGLIMPVYADEIDMPKLSEDAVTLGFSENEDDLDEDDVVKAAGYWYEWDDATGTLTLKNDLPDTSFDEENVEYNSFAALLGIDPAEVRCVDIRPNTRAGKSLVDAFYEFTALREIKGLSNLDTSKTENMYAMFFNCYSLMSLDLSNFNTEKVMNMAGMFYGCRSLKTLDLTAFNTEKVWNFSFMFEYCDSLTSLDISSFKLWMMRDADSMFRKCDSLVYIHLGYNLDVTKEMMLPNYTKQFTGWKAMHTGEIVGGTGEDAEFVAYDYHYIHINKCFSWDNNKNTLTISGKIPDTTSLLTLPYQAGVDSDMLEHVVIKKGTTVSDSLSSAFQGRSSLKSIDGLENVSLTNKTDTSYMFDGCNSLEYVDLSGFSTSSLFSRQSMFSDCNALTKLKLPAGFVVSPEMYLPNKTGSYGGWSQANNNTIISGDGYYADFTASAAGDYTRSSLFVAIKKLEPGNRKVSLTWDAYPGAVSYNIYIHSRYSEEKKYTRTGTGAYLNDLSNFRYSVCVTAVDKNGVETAKQGARAFTPGEYYVPCTTQAIESGTIEISWKKYDGALRYRVVCIDKNNNVRDTKTTSKLSFKWTGLKNNETYGFYVQPYLDMCGGIYPTFNRTDANDKKYIQWTCPVNAPMITKLSLGNKKVWLYYESVPRATKYYIYVTQDGVKDKLRGTTTATKFLVTGLTNKDNASYHEAEFYVKALVDGKLTPLKRPAKRWTRAGMKPGITLSSGQAVLKWSKYTDCKASASKYKVVLVDANYKTISSRETNNLSFTWKGLKKGTKYGFYVVPYVNGEYIPFGLSHAEDKANVVMFTAK